MISILSKIKLEKEALAAICLTVLFGAFLLINFISGFNLFFYVIIAIIGLIIPVIYPRSGLYAIILLTLIFAKFFTLQSLWINDIEYKIYLVDILMLSTLFGLWLRLINKKIKISLKKVDILLFIFMILTGLYFLASVFYLKTDFNLAFSSLKNYVFYPLLYFIVLFLIDNRKRLEQLFKFVISGGIIIIGFILYGLLAGQGLWTDITPLSTSGSRILDFDHAFYLSLISLLGLSYLLVNKEKLVKLWYVLLPIFAIGIVGSLMRHLWIAMIFSWLFIYVIIKKNYRTIFRKLSLKYIAGVVLILSVVIMFINLLPYASTSRELLEVQDNVIHRVVSITDSSDSSIAWRGSVWSSVWGEYKNNVVLGLGFGKKIFIDMGNYRDYVEVRNIHNSWLAILVQMGLVGFLTFIIFYFTLIKNTIKQKVKDNYLIILKLSSLGIAGFCLIAFLFQPYLEANFFNIIFWINLGLMRRLHEGITS